MSSGHLLRSAGLVLAYAAVGFCGLVITGALTGTAASGGALLFARAVIVAAGLAGVTVFAARRRGLGVLVLLAALGYAACPAAWVGRALLAQAVWSPGPVAILADLVLWLAVVAGAAAAAWRHADTQTLRH